MTQFTATAHKAHAIAKRKWRKAFGPLPSVASFALIEALGVKLFNGENLSKVALANAMYDRPCGAPQRNDEGNVTAVLVHLFGEGGPQLNVRKQKLLAQKLIKHGDARDALAGHSEMHYCNILTAKGRKHAERNGLNLAAYDATRAADYGLTPAEPVNEPVNEPAQAE
jgi:hypothetical protein